MSEGDVMATTLSEPQVAAVRRSPLHALVRGVFGIRADEARFDRRGFVSSPAQPLLEAAGGSFVDGYNLALTGRADAIDAALGDRPVHLRGFFAEGAAMGAAIAGLLPPWTDRLAELLARLGDRYPHLMHVGVGWAVARVPLAKRRFAAPLDPLLGWLAVDGRGFHDGFFHRARVAAGWRAVGGAPAAIYDQGVGRSMWFSCGADPDRIAAAIAALPAERVDDLWAGVGLAAVYAGGIEPDALDGLAPGAARRWLRQGAGFAIAAHARAGMPPARSGAAAERITGLVWPKIVDLVADAEAQARAADLPSLGRYQLWRSLIADFLEQRAA